MRERGIAALVVWWASAAAFAVIVAGIAYVLSPNAPFGFSSDLAPVIAGTSGIAASVKTFADLIDALDSGQLSYAALDALWPEPLPPTSPLWLHPKVTVMPHVARRPTVAQIVTEIAANIRSIQAGGRLLQEVDISTGY